MTTSLNSQPKATSASKQDQDDDQCVPILLLENVEQFGWLPDHYQVDKATSQKAFGSLSYHNFVALDTRNSTIVAINAVSGPFLNASAKRQFVLNSKKLSTIESEFFLQPLDWGIVSDFAFVAREYDNDLAMGELFSCNATKFSIMEKLTAIRSVVRALVSVHDAGCVQRQFTSMQFIEQDFKYRLTCAGPSAYVSSSHVKDERAIEFAETASPELAGSIDHDIGAPSDIYSLGIFIYKILSGNVPFSGADTNTILLEHMTCSPDWKALNEHPKALISIVKHALSKDPSGRYQTSQSLLDDLNSVIQSLSKGQKLSGFCPGRSDSRSTLMSPQFVGRQSELEELVRNISSQSAGTSKTCVLGAAGEGKTRFVLEALRQTSGNGALLFQTKASQEAGESPMAPVVAVAKQIAGFPRLVRSLREELVDYKNELSQVLPDFAKELGWEPDLSDPFSGPDQLCAKLLCRAVAQLIGNLGSQKKPAILWIDDCQWLDGTLLEVLKELDTIQLRHTTVILSMRDQAMPSFQELEEKLGRTKTIQLTPLSNNEIISLIQSMAGKIPDKATELVIRIAGGSPFLASAVIRGLVETKAMFFENGDWKIDDSRFENAGASTDAAVLLTQRIETLPPNSACALKLAAINGREFDYQTILSISGLSSEVADIALSNLRKSRLIWQRPDGRFTFVHDQIRDSVLGLIPSTIQSEMHSRIASFLVQGIADNTLEFESNLNQKIAYHYHNANCPEKGYEYAVRAARDAKRKFSLDIAIEFFKIAIAGCSKESEKDCYQNYVDLADVLMLAGDYTEANKWFREAGQWARSPEELAIINMKVGELAFKRGNKENAVENFESALAQLGCPGPTCNFMLAIHLVREILIQIAHSLFPTRFVGRHATQPGGQLRMIWKSYSRLAHGYWYTRNLYWVLWAHLRGMNEAETYLPTEELAQAYSEHAPAMSLIPWSSRGEKYALRSLEIRENQNYLWGQGQSKGFYSVLMFSTSQYKKCVDAAQSAEIILKQTGDAWETNIASYQLAAAHMRMGNFKKSVEICQSTYHNALSIGDFQSTGNILDVWVRASGHGLPIEVLSLEKSRLLRDYQGQCQLLLAEGINSFHINDYQSAIDCFQHAIEVAKKNGVVNPYTSSSFVWLARAKRKNLFAHPPASKQATQAALRDCYRSAKKAVRISKRFKNDLPHAYRELAIVSALTGRTNKAKRSIIHSIGVATSQSATFELALSLKSFGQLGTEYGWPGASSANDSAEEMLSLLDRDLLADQKQVSMSLMEQFDLLLDAGREIFSASKPEIILQTTVNAAIRLLKARRVFILAPNPKCPNEWISVQDDQEYDHSLVSETVQQNRTVVHNKETLETYYETHTGTYLCSPIHVGDRIAALVYIANEYVTNCFGENEIRIADYLANAAGSALEKADGFRQLAELNMDLEQKVLARTESLQKQTNDLELAANELREAQLKLETARIEAETANQTKSDFLARMSHEIRTPITAVMGYTELILRGIVTDPADCRDKLEIINSSGKHLLSLVNDILDLSKIEADMLTVEIIDCSPARIVHDTFESLTSNALSKGIELNLEFESAIPKQMQADPTRLTQIVTNLVSNAIKFTSEGSVTIAVRMDGPQDESQIVIEISDTGVGMTKEQASRIFDPFVQADTSTTRQFGGTGLGLSITKQLIQLLGGDLLVESEIGIGSTFTARIPALCADSTLLAPDEIEKLIREENDENWLKGNLAGIHVLVVDDAPTNQELLSYFLTDSGATTTIAGNGQEAIELIAANDIYDIVLMDMQMPVLGGSEATRILRTRLFGKPIIALTANSMKGDEDSCIAAGCSAYMSKPIDTNLLITTICRFAQRSVQSINCQVETSDPTQANLSAGPSKVTSTPEADTGLSNLSAELQEALPVDEPFRRLAIRFIAKLDEKMPEFIEAGASQESKDLKFLTHWIKGTAGSIQLHELSELAEKVETAVLENDWDAAQEPFDRIVDLMDYHIAP